MSTERLANRLLASYPSEAARVLAGFPPSEVAALLDRAERDAAAEVLGRTAPSFAADVVEALRPERRAELVETMPPHRAARMLRLTAEEIRSDVLARLPAKRARDIRPLLIYEPGTAGSLMDPRAFARPEDDQVSDVLAAVREGCGTGHYVYVTDGTGRLVGVVGLRQLFAAEARATLASIMERRVSRLRAHDDSTAILAHPGWVDFHALPVVDDAGVLIGALRYRTVRRLELESSTESRAPVSLVVSLAELYWLGLTGLTEGVAAVVERRARADASGQEGARG